MNLVAEALGSFRLEHKMSQKELAAMIGLTPMQVSNLERGASMPSLGTLQQIARLFRWTPTEIGSFVLTITVPQRRKVK